MAKLITKTPPATLTQQQIVVNEKSQITGRLETLADGILDSTKSARAMGADVLYGSGIEKANERVGMVGTQPIAGIIAADILLRVVASIYNPESDAANTPIPAGMDIEIKDSAGNVVDVAAIASYIAASLAPIITASSVKVIAKN